MVQFGPVPESARRPLPAFLRNKHAKAFSASGIPQAGLLLHVLDAQRGNDAALRPNQIFAVGVAGPIPARVRR